LSSFAFGTLVKNRLQVYQYLNENGIESRPLICGSMGLQPMWIRKYGKLNLPNADIVHEYGIYLPNHASLNELDIKYICEKFNEIAEPYFFK
jgi:CDP-6-deoxy-D-xylo-4-hexulose-3-dehydrase